MTTKATERSRRVVGDVGVTDITAARKLDRFHPQVLQLIYHGLRAVHREERFQLIVTASKLPTDQPYTCGMIATVAAWVCGMAVSVLLIATGALETDRRLAAMVVLGSGVVALAAAVPGMVHEQFDRRAVGEMAAERLAIGFSSGVVIRLLGTVALLGLCSYHLPAAKEQIAGWTLAWYVYLTTIDVTALAVLLPRRDGRLEREAK